MSDDTIISKEMGITHEEFFRNIPRVLGSGDYIQEDDRVVLQSGDKRLEIKISEQGERRIALFVLPVTHVTLTFRGYDDGDVSATIERFDRAFQRGGG